MKPDPTQATGVGDWCRRLVSCNKKIGPGNGADLLSCSHYLITQTHTLARSFSTSSYSDSYSDSVFSVLSVLSVLNTLQTHLTAAPIASRGTMRPGMPKSGVSLGASTESSGSSPGAISPIRLRNKCSSIGCETSKRTNI